jgi:hypothetical protein
MATEIQEATHFDISMYHLLKDPKFISQTSVNAQGVYWMVFESNGALFKFQCSLTGFESIHTS